jgi:hypothetical protein
MPYKSRSERERARWATLPEVIEHVMAADGCDGDAARQQVRSALYDGALNPLKWEDRQPSPRNVGGIAVPLDDPQLMPDSEIDWDAGTLLDVSEYSPPPGRHRRLLILWLRVREHWPEKEAEANSGGVADISAARRNRGRPPVERKATAAKMREDLQRTVLTREELRDMGEEALAARYNVHRATAVAARKIVLSENDGNPR